MAETLLRPASDSRLAKALARLLRQLAVHLARTDHDRDSLATAAKGLARAAEVARSLDARGLSDFLLALRERSHADEPAGEPLFASEAWPLLGAPRCSALALMLEEVGFPRAIGDDAEDWKGLSATVLAFEEPGDSSDATPAEAADAANAADATEAVAAPSPFEIALADVLRTHGLAPPPGASIRVRCDPEELDLLVAALAPWIVEEGMRIAAPPGRIEMSGRCPYDAGLPHELRLAAARADIAAGLDTNPHGTDWWVRLLAAESPHYLFVEAEGERIALPWHRVVAYGLTDGADRPHVVLGAGFERLAMPLDWLHGKGVGARRIAEGRVTVEDQDGQAYRELWIARPEIPVPAPPRQVSRPAEPLQSPALPADNPMRSEAPGLCALVADDSVTARVFLARLLVQRGIEVDEAEDLSAVMGQLAARPYDLVFLDADMPGLGALALPRADGPAWLDRAVLLVKDDDERKQAESLGFAHVLLKPFAEDEVVAAVRAIASKLRPGVS